MGKVHPTKEAKRQKGPPLGRQELETMLVDVHNSMRAYELIFQQVVSENARTNPEDESDDVTIVMSEEEYGALSFTRFAAIEQIERTVARFYDSAGFEQRRTGS